MGITSLDVWIDIVHSHISIQKSFIWRIGEITILLRLFFLDIEARGCGGMTFWPKFSRYVSLLWTQNIGLVSIVNTTVNISDRWLQWWFTLELVYDIPWWHIYQILSNYIYSSKLNFFCNKWCATNGCLHFVHNSGTSKAMKWAECGNHSVQVRHSQTLFMSWQLWANFRSASGKHNKIWRRWYFAKLDTGIINRWNHSLSYRTILACTMCAVHLWSGLFCIPTTHGYLDEHVLSL